MSKVLLIYIFTLRPVNELTSSDQKFGYFRTVCWQRFAAAMARCRNPAEVHQEVLKLANQ
jgi:hypothetical protein